jgi:predicted acyltransferase
VAWDGATIAAAGAVLGNVFPIERSYGSLTCLLLGRGRSQLVEGALFHLHAARGCSIPLLQVLGRNAVVLFMLSAVVTLVPNAVVPTDAEGLPVLLGTGAVLGLCVLVGLVLDWWGST